MDIYKFYRDQLIPLTTNQKYLITNLTILAQQYHDFANQIVDAIRDHLNYLPPSKRLPTLYLIDSITKNNPQLQYRQLFSQFIHVDWLNTYNNVDGSIRSKLEELVITWRNGGPFGSSVFGKYSQTVCEQRLYGEGGWKANIPLSYGPSRTLVITELQSALEKRKLFSQLNPLDQKAKSHIHALSTLERILTTTTVPPEQLSQIYDRVKSMSVDNLPIQNNFNVHNNDINTPIQIPPPLPTPTFNNNIISKNNTNSIPPAAAPIPLLPQSNSILQSLTPPPVPPPTQPPSNVSSLLQSLQNSGLLKVPSDASNTNSGYTPEPENNGNKNDSDNDNIITSDNVDENEKQYDNAVLALDIQLDNNDILK